MINQNAVDEKQNREKVKEFLLENAEKFEQLKGALGVSIMDYNSFDDYMRDLIACLDSEALQDYADSITSLKYKKMTIDEKNKREGEIVQ